LLRNQCFIAQFSQSLTAPVGLSFIPVATRLNPREAQSGVAPPAVLPDQPGQRVRRPNQADANNGDTIARGTNPCQKGDQLIALLAFCSAVLQRAASV
jgi:hypothetical protein